MHDTLITEELDRLALNKKVGSCSRRSCVVPPARACLLMPLTHSLARVSQFSGNKKKLGELASMTIGESGMAQTLSVMLSAEVKKQIFSKISRDFTARFEKLVKYCTGVMASALSGDVKDLMQLDGFSKSLQAAREVRALSVEHRPCQCLFRLAGLTSLMHGAGAQAAGMIKTIYDSKVVPSCFKAEDRKKELPTIFKFAEGEAPIGLLGAGAGFALASGAMAPPGRGPSWRADEEEEEEPTSPAPVVPMAPPPVPQWQCPNCNVFASNTDMIKKGPYPLKGPPCDQAVGCWCEKLPRTLPPVEYCWLCVRYFNWKHMLRTSKQEKQRNYAKRRLGADDSKPAKKQRTTRVPDVSTAHNEQREADADAWQISIQNGAKADAEAKRDAEREADGPVSICDSSSVVSI